MTFWRWRARKAEREAKRVAAERAAAERALAERAPALFDRKSVATHRNAEGELDLPERLKPWIDHKDADVEGYVRALGPRAAPGLAENLRQWRDRGYVIFPGAASLALIDRYLADLAEVFRAPEKYDVLVNHNVLGIHPARELSREELAHPLVRVLDFHNASVAGKKLVLLPQVVSFLEHVFGEQVVGMQTLTFQRGSQQEEHQDFAFVVSGNPSHLAASWIALEDVHAEAGPLGYFPGSHHVRRFDFGNGMFMTTESPRREIDFLAHLRAECQRLSLPEEIFLARKGDVFVWHGALVHRGTPVRDPRRTRLSLASHYSSLSAYPRDRRDPTVTPRRYTYNGGIVYGDPVRPHNEDLFNGADQGPE